MPELGKWLIVAGGVLVLVGIMFLLVGKVPYLGRLPGDIRVSGKGGKFYLPLATCPVLSIILTIVLNVILRLFGRH